MQDEKPPPRTPGLRYRPSTVRSPAVPPEGGENTFYGDVRLSTQGRPGEQDVARLHEAFHQFLAPKFYLLRRFRVENRVHSYFQSSLYRYIEEALAEAIGRWGAYGFQKAFDAISFPTERGYVYVTRGGGYADGMAGRGVVPEGASLITAGLIQGFGFRVWYRPGNPARTGGMADAQDFMGRHAGLFAAGLGAVP